MQAYVNVDADGYAYVRPYVYVRVETEAYM